MSSPDPETPSAKVRGVFRGLGEVAEFLREAAVAVAEVAAGKWPRPAGADRGETEPEQPKAPNQGMGPIQKIAPYPTDD